MHQSRNNAYGKGEVSYIFKRNATRVNKLYRISFFYYNRTYIAAKMWQINICLSLFVATKLVIIYLLTKRKMRYIIYICYKCNTPKEEDYNENNMF